MKKCYACNTKKGGKRTNVKIRCDALARELCRTLAGGKCARCGGVGSDWAHRMPRRHFATRWLMSNCDFLCRPCHVFFTMHPASFHNWLVAQGVDVDRLERMANDPWSRDYSEVIVDLTVKLKEAKEKAA